jgi:hypothetical protein
LLQSPLYTLSQALALRRITPKQPRKGKAPQADFVALCAVIDRITTRFQNPASFAKLTHGEQLVYGLGFEMDGEVINGGWHQFLANSSGDNAERDKAYLREVGAGEVLALLERVSAVFPNGVVPTERTRRNKDLIRAEEADEDRFDAIFDPATNEYSRVCPEFYTRLMDYVEAHQEEFTRPDDAEVKSSGGAAAEPRS